MTGSLIERPKTVADILTAAADLIDKPGAWIQGAWARDAKGRHLDHGADPKAVCWCTFGAVRNAAGHVDLSRSIETLRKVISSEGRWVSIHNWNDAPERTQAEVVAALRAAAEKARTDSSPGIAAGDGPKPPETVSPLGGA